MTTPNIQHIDLSKLAGELRQYERQWIAIAEDNRIVASGPTYGETVRKVVDADRVVLMKVPPLDYSLAP